MDAAWSSQLKRGTVELAVLAALRGGGEAYGYELLGRLSASPPLATTESTLYPLLARLTAEGLLAVRQEPSASGPPRRYYRLTAHGQRHLSQLVGHWRSFRGALDALADAEPNRSKP